MCGCSRGESPRQIFLVDNKVYLDLDLRQEIFNRCKNLDLIWLSDAERLVWIFEHKIFALAEYLEKAWDKRTKKMYV